MAPLVPEIISEGLNFLIAFIIGIGFGFVLEQAGFSSSKKLAGLFYGRDFTVLRVFFTAAITAMIGILFLGYFDLLNLEMIYINPTYMGGAIVGGIIMGIGFIIGGFCPGTSVCAAAIGKKDAMAFIFGSLIGILIFTEGNTLFKDIYNYQYLGNVKVYDSLNMSAGMFAFLLIFIAIITFIVTTIIENRVNNVKGESSVTVIKKYGISIAISLLLGIALIYMPNKEQRLQKGLSDTEFMSQQEYNYYSCDQIAYELIDNNQSLQIIDLRTPKEYKAFSLPTAINIPYDSLVNSQWNSLIDKTIKNHIFYCNEELDAQKASIISSRLGYENNYVLKGGMNMFQQLIMHPTQKKQPTKQDIADYKFRSHASSDILALIKEQENNKKVIVPKKRKVIKGGC